MPSVSLKHLLSGPKQCRDSIKGLLDCHGTFHTGGYRIVNIPNVQFGSVFIPRLPCQAQPLQLMARPQHNVDVDFFSPANVRKYILRLNPRKSPGMDGIHPYASTKWAGCTPPVPASSLSQPGPASSIRGHARRLSGLVSTKCLQRAKTFTNRIVNEWNALPATVTDADSVNKFKNGYDAFRSTFSIRNYFSMCYVQGATIVRLCKENKTNITYTFCTKPTFGVCLHEQKVGAVCKICHDKGNEL
ncbi:RNA-directed DNA polymerase from mobile element jockey-like [Brachionus plicatilis]|uniref:RNA-directed DNA polymerase from mobile element jockey-like n=1 Tax=Brachionus plicatilis TaxID=10195 RepID=A0A3M7R6L0_BRAPC|nr:RNA-directed DNA polymerase from mobile element jockey-like [Brachionus plicatilis]